MKRLLAGFTDGNGQQLKFGEQLQDDLINSFCDKIQMVCPTKIEALFAIQFLSFSDPSEFQSVITGEHHVCQVLFDARRRHYLLLHYDPHDHVVNVYDSMQCWKNDDEPFLCQETMTSIERLFGHIFEECIFIQVDRQFEKQNDGFSCGYRVIGAITALARGENPATLTYSRTQILNFMQSILDDPSPKWEAFEQADIASEKIYSDSGIYQIHLINPEKRKESENGSTANFESCRDIGQSQSSLDSFGSVEDLKLTETRENHQESQSISMMTTPPAISMDSSVFSSFLRILNGFSFFPRNDKLIEIDG